MKNTLQHLRTITFAVIALIVLIPGLSLGQIAAWDFAGVGSSSLPTYAATTFTSNLVSTSGASNITRGATAGWSTGGNSFRTTGFKNEGISITNTDYFQITLTAATGFKVSLSTIDAKFGGSGSFYATPGVTSQFAYSLDGSTFNLIGSPVQSTSLTLAQISLTGITALQNVAAGTTITLRYYASGQTTTGGWGFLSAATAGTNGLAIGGTVSSTSGSAPVITTPTATGITTSSANLGGNITSDGGSAITERGTVWKAGSGVTITDNPLAEGGTATGVFSHLRSSLPAGTTIFYRAYAINGIGTTLSAESSFATLSNEPSNHASSFTATANSQTSITTTWSDNDGAQAASGFLVMANLTGTFTDPVDGVAQTGGVSLSGGSEVVNVLHGVQTYTWSNGLSAGTTYYFKIFPYNGSGTSINYKTDATVPTANATTTAALDATSEVSGPVLGSQPNPVTISSLITTDVAAVRVFDMNIVDYATSDAQPTKVTQVTVKAGANNTANWANTILGVKLSVDGGTSFVTMGSAVITASSIVIPITAGNLNVPNAGTLTLSLYIYLKASGLTDNQVLEFKVDATAASHGFTADPTGSTFLATFSAAPVSRQILIDVAATKYNFSTQPSNTTVNTNFSAAIEAIDANGNRDLDATGVVTLAASAGTLSSVIGLTPNLAAGAFSWTDLQNNTAGTGITLIATGSLPTATSTTFKIFSAQPTIQASAIVFANVGLNSMTVSWIKGNGANRILVAKASGTPTVPTNGTSYAANSVFGSGGTIAANEFVLYNGAGSTVDITGLTASTSYTFKVFEYNGSAGTENYMITSNATSQATGSLSYYSNGSGDPAVLTNWKTNRDGSGTSPANFTSGETFVIENGDNMSTTTTWAISGTSSKLQIESGGTLTANNAVTLATATNFRIDNGGTYIHNYATAASSTIFAGTESFAALSNIRLDNWVNNTTSITTGVTLPYGNLEINYSANASNWQQGISGTITLCAGNLTITSVGTGTIRFSAGTAPTITVGGNYTQAAGTVNMASTAGSSVCVLNVAGNFAVNGGSFTSTSTGSKVVFNGSGTQNFTNAGTISTVNFEVGSSSSLNMGTQVLTGGSFALPAGATLKTANTGGIDGSITVTGAKTLNAAANYVFNGSLAQVTGTSLTATVNNLTVDNASGLTLSNTALTVNGTLLINSGMKLEIGPGKQLTVAGTLTNSAGNTGLVLKSDATGAGSLIHNTADVPATIERYISGAAIPGVGSATAYHFVSVPLTSGGTSNQFAGSYLYDFNESRDLWNSLGASTSTALYNSRGYLIYYPSDNITYPFSGNMNNGSFTPLTTFTTDDDTVKGYNLVPNPYPSAINWTAASGWTKTNVENKVWIWNNGSYATYNAAGPDSTSGGKRFIPVGQAFFVHADGLGAPVLTMDNPVRTHLTNAFLKDAVVPISYRLSLVASMGESSDEIVVKFNDEASMEKDMYDMNKIPGDQFTPQLSSLNPAGERLSINALPFSEGDVVVPLEFKLNAATEVTFTASGLESFYMGIPIYLEDRAMNKVIDLHTNPVYTFTHSTLSAGNRFQLRFLGVTATPVQPEVTPGSAFVSQGKLFVDVPSMAQSAAVISVYDALGRQLSSRKTVLNGVMQLPAPVVPGVYVVRVMSGDKTFTAKVVVK